MSLDPLICEPFLLSQQRSGLLKHVTEFHGTCEDKAYPGPSAPALAVTQQVSAQVPEAAQLVSKHLQSHRVVSRSLPNMLAEQGPQKVTRAGFLPPS